MGESSRAETELSWACVLLRYGRFRYWAGIQRHINFVVEYVVAALVDIVRDAEWRKDNEATKNIADDPPGPGTVDLERGRLIAVLVRFDEVVAFAAERDDARRSKVQIVVDDDRGFRRVGENGDRLFVGMHPGSAARESSDQGAAHERPLPYLAVLHFPLHLAV